jgi:hypothetical protein
MLILMRYDGINNRIILFYHYKITSLLLTHSMKQVKTCNIKGSLSTQKKGSKPYALRHKHIPSLFPLHLHLLLLNLHKSSLIPSLMSFYHTKYLIPTSFSEGPPTTPPQGSLKNFVQVFVQEKIYNPEDIY